MFLAKYLASSSSRMNNGLEKLPCSNMTTIFPMKECSTLATHISIIFLLDLNNCPRRSITTGVGWVLPRWSSSFAGGSIHLCRALNRSLRATLTQKDIIVCPCCTLGECTAKVFYKTTGRTRTCILSQKSAHSHICHSICGHKDVYHSATVVILYSGQ